MIFMFQTQNMDCILDEKCVSNQCQILCELKLMTSEQT